MNIKELFTEKELEEMFIFLDDLRESGETNMYGAAPYVQREFGVSYNEASEIVSTWMKTFSERHGKWKSKKNLLRKKLKKCMLT